MTVQGSSRYCPAHNIIHQSEAIYDGEEPKQAEGCMTNVFPVGGVIVRAVIGCFATLPRKDITHPFTRFLWRDVTRPLTGYSSSCVGGAAHSLPVADVITQLTGHAADQLPVVFLVRTLKLKMSTTDQCCPDVEYEVKFLIKIYNLCKNYFMDSLH